MTSMLEYLAGLRKRGHTPLRLGEVQVGLTHYAAGEFIDRATNLKRIALMPMYRTDWARRGDMTTPELLPASYRHNHGTVYEFTSGDVWFISGWRDTDRVLWLNKLPMDLIPGVDPIKPAQSHWTESFDAAMALARSGIGAQSPWVPE